MAFPTNPTNNQEYITPLGTVYKYNSTDARWNLSSTTLTGMTGAQGHTGSQGYTGIGFTGLQGPTGLSGNAKYELLAVRTSTTTYNDEVGPLNFNSIIYESTPTGFNTSNDTFTAPHSGRYKVSFQTTFEATGTSTLYGAVYIRVPNTTKQYIKLIDSFKTDSGVSPQVSTDFTVEIDLLQGETFVPTMWIDNQTHDFTYTIYGSLSSAGYTGWNPTFLTIHLLDISAYGATGIQGLTGAQAVTGAQGHTGAQGYTGLEGLRGTTGAVGVTGAFGGPQGVTGLQGIQGTIGQRGATGLQGATGAFDTTAWTSYTPTGVIGWTGNYIATCAYKRISKTVFFKYNIYGNFSNSGTIVFSIPVNTNDNIYAASFVYNNSLRQDTPGVLFKNDSSSVKINRTWDTATENFTSSGFKQATGEFFYEEA